MVILTVFLGNHIKQLINWIAGDRCIILFVIRFFLLSTISVDNFVNNVEFEQLTYIFLKVFLSLINYVTLNLCVAYQLVVFSSADCANVCTTTFTSYINCGLFEMSRKNIW